MTSNLKKKARRPLRKQRWVIKAGSNLICSGGPLLIRSWMQQVAQLRRDYNIEVVWVTSGAIATAVERTGFRKEKKNLAAKQALSAIGQPLIMDLYDLALQVNGLLGAQVLLTYDDLAHTKRRQNFKNTINQLLQWEVMPVLNENDAIATEEIQFGDNDSLSAKVARTIGAQRLVILTDVDGLFDSDPSTNPQAQLIPTVEKVNASILSLATSHSSSGRGRGGMLSKLLAAKEAVTNGIDTWLVKGDRPRTLLDIAQNRALGTYFSAKIKRKKSNGA